jgi:hypothetical protein
VVRKRLADPSLPTVVVWIQKPGKRFGRAIVLDLGRRQIEPVVQESGGRIIRAPPKADWAHARREFVGALWNEPKGAHCVLALVGQGRWLPDR